jgi:hypothetical protein
MVDMIRQLLTLAAIAGAVLALGACGSGKDDKSPGNHQDEAFDGALKFAKCMRDHGIDMPDPDPTGKGATRLGGPGDDPKKFEAAAKACGLGMSAKAAPANE